MHHIFWKIQRQLLLPGGLGVNVHVPLAAQNLIVGLMPLDTNIGSLAIESLLFADQLDGQPFQFEPSRLRDEKPILTAGLERMMTDFNDRRADSDTLAKLGEKVAKGPMTDEGKRYQ